VQVISNVARHGVRERGAATSRHRRARPVRRDRQPHLAAALCLVVAGTVLLGPVTVPTAVREVALFAHLIALVVGFGAVVVVDWYALQWLASRRTLDEVLALAGAVTPLIWGGLTGLVTTGALLSPDTGSRLTLVKMGFVLAVTSTASALRPYVVSSARRSSTVEAAARPRDLDRRDVAAVLVGRGDDRLRQRAGRDRRAARHHRLPDC
jgi:di/tricarboxylate transporter